ncbi:MAG: UDP-N-acetylmuramoyl-L-alanyl-D-glutamate--2,6-diaminopimelate ligase, partial [Candidatus Micrarchaeia archaeon]
NPRNEDPLTICQQIQQGIDKNKKEVMVELDRKEAIKKAISIAKKNDIILIAGKGHEKYQIIGNKIIPFSDKEFSLEILKQVTIEPTIT